MDARKLQKEKYIGEGHIRSEIRAAEHFVLHAHDYYEIEAVLAGKGTHTLNGKVSDLVPGTVYLLTPADFHCVDFEDSLSLINISFDETVASRAGLLRLFSSTPFTAELDAKSLEKLKRAAELIMIEDRSENMIPLTEYVFRLISSGDVQERDPSPIEKSVAFIESHFREAPSLCDAAAVACLSPVYFGMLFKRETGKTYVEYLNGCRIECAAMLLKSGKSVTEACFGSGFGSLSGFLYTFRQIKGISPAQYKKCRSGEHDRYEEQKEEKLS